MGKKRKATAELHYDKREGWGAKITLPDGVSVFARSGDKQKIIYDKPERVPTHLRDNIVPKLMAEARTKNLTGERP